MTLLEGGLTQRLTCNVDLTEVDLESVRAILRSWYVYAGTAVEAGRDVSAAVDIAEASAEDREALLRWYLAGGRRTEAAALLTDQVEYREKTGRYSEQEAAALREVAANFRAGG